MNIQIITYSQTGKTLSVSKLLYDDLNKLKFKVSFDEIKVIDKKIPRPNPFTIELSPELKGDIIVLATLVEGFLPSPVMMEYINNHDFSNKKVICVVTHFFPFAWMGGNSAIKKMANLLIGKKANVIATGIINWSSKQRVVNISEVIKVILISIKKENK